MKRFRQFIKEHQINTTVKTTKEPNPLNSFKGDDEIVNKLNAPRPEPIKGVDMGPNVKLNAGRNYQNSKNPLERAKSEAAKSHTEFRLPLNSQSKAGSATSSLYQDKSIRSNKSNKAPITSNINDKNSQKVYMDSGARENMERVFKKLTDAGMPMGKIGAFNPRYARDSKDISQHATAAVDIGDMQGFRNMKNKETVDWMTKNRQLYHDILKDAGTVDGSAFDKPGQGHHDPGHIQALPSQNPMHQYSTPWKDRENAQATGATKTPGMSGSPSGSVPDRKPSVPMSESKKIKSFKKYFKEQQDIQKIIQSQGARQIQKELERTQLAPDVKDLQKKATSPPYGWDAKDIEKARSLTSGLKNDIRDKPEKYGPVSDTKLIQRELDDRQQKQKMELKPIDPNTMDKNMEKDFETREKSNQFQMPTLKDRVNKSEPRA